MTARCVLDLVNMNIIHGFMQDVLFGLAARCVLDLGTPTHIPMGGPRKAGEFLRKPDAVNMPLVAQVSDCLHEIDFYNNNRIERPISISGTENCCWCWILKL